MSTKAFNLDNIPGFCAKCLLMDGLCIHHLLFHNLIKHTGARIGARTSVQRSSTAAGCCIHNSRSGEGVVRDIPSDLFYLAFSIGDYENREPLESASLKKPDWI